MLKKHSIFILFFLIIGTSTHADHIIPKVEQRAKTTVAFHGGLETRFKLSPQKPEAAIELTEFLQNETGLVHFQQANSNPNELTINMRGFGDNANANHLLLINGFPYNYSVASPNLNFLPLNGIEQIILFSGSQGVRYGNGAVGGSVRVVTHAPTQNDMQLSSSVGNHSSNQVQNQFAWMYASNRYVQVWAQLLHQNTQREWQEREQRTVGFQWGGEFNQGLFKLQVMDYEYLYELPGALTATQYALSPNQSNNKNNEITTRIQHLQWLHHQPFGLQHFLETRFWIEQQQGWGKIAVPFTQNQHLSFLEWRLRGQRQKQTYLLGILLQHNTYEFAAKVNQFADSNQFDIFVETEWPVLTRTQLTAGVRYSQQWNQFEKTGTMQTDLHPTVGVMELGMEHRFTNALLGYIRRDGNFRMVKANEALWSLSNTHLQTQTGVSYESGVHYTHPYGETQVNVFRLLLNNEIAFNPQQNADYPFGSYQKFSPTQRDGWLVHQVWQLHPRVRLQYDVSQIIGRFSADNKRIPAQAEWNNNLGLHFSINEALRFAYRFDYQGERYASDDIQNQCGLQPSVLLHGFSMMVDDKNWHASLAIDNIFNKKYASYTLFSPDTTALSFFPGNGRAILFTVRFTTL